MSIIQFVTYEINDNLYGTDILQVKEIVAGAKISQVPHSGREIAGLVNLRGQIFLIINLSFLLKNKSENILPAEDGELIIFKEQTGESFGIIVDKIGDVLSFESSEINSYYDGEQESSGNRLISGVCKFEDKLMTVVDANAILSNAVNGNFNPKKLVSKI